MLIGVQLAPEKDFSRYDWLIDLGVDHFSFCFELLDPAWFARICPGKQRTLGQRLFFDAMEYCARRSCRMARYRARSSRASSPSSTPSKRSTYHRHRRVPDRLHLPADHWIGHGGARRRLVRRHAHRDAAVYDACRRHGFQSARAQHRGQSRRQSGRCRVAGAADESDFYCYEAWRRTLRVAAKPVFHYRMRTAARRASGSRVGRDMNTAGSDSSMDPIVPRGRR